MVDANTTIGKAIRRNVERVEAINKRPLSASVFSAAAIKIIPAPIKSMFLSRNISGDICIEYIWYRE